MIINGSQVDLNLGVVGNCQYAALIDRAARVLWCCLPRFDGDPVFNALLQGVEPSSDAADGVFDITLERPRESQQAYIANTAVLRTVLTDESGASIEVIDFAPRFRMYGRSFRPAVLIRQIKPIAGTPRIRIRMRPTFNYGSCAPIKTHGSNHIRYGTSGNAIRLTTDCPLTYVMEETWFHLERPLTFWVGPDEPVAANLDATAHEFLEQTIDYWKQWVRTLAIPYEWQDAVIRAAIALKLCWFEETGAIVAALTTSIPEAANTHRTWDYRYCWLRDSFYVIQALNRLGAIDIMESYLGYLRNLPGVALGQHIQPVYGINLRANLDEHQETGLRGYRHMGPVRVGNQAFEHVQNDVYGQVVLSATQAFLDQRLLTPMTTAQFEQLERVGERAFAIYDQPDASLWELRTREAVHTYSVAMSWAACDRLALIARHRGLIDKSKNWQKRADAIQSWLRSNLWDDKAKCYRSSLSGSETDASLLQLVELGCVAPDARLEQTVAHIEKRLLRSGHVFRYDEADDFGVPQAAFNICTFWYIDALYRLNRTDDARNAYEALLNCRNHVGLLSEGIDVSTKELWGNYPQTYSQVGVINSATRLSKAWRDAI